MISDHTKQKLDELFAAQGSYQPNEQIKAQLATKNMLMFVGATCEGKNTIMNNITKLDDRLKIVGTFTSRDRRLSDLTPYTYYTDSDAGLADVLARIDRQEVVQYAINPYAYLIYGSEITDYFSDYNLGDVFASAVDSFRQLGFKRAIAITVISEPSAWLKRFDERFPRDDPNRRARREEAIESFTWSLSQTGDDHFWVENVIGQPDAAARIAIDIALGASNGQPEARRLAEASLKVAKTIAL